MPKPIGEDALDTLFRQARTHTTWLATPVPDALLKRVYDLAALGPTSANSQPMRVVFVKSQEAKARLLPGVAEGNVPKVKAAPVCAIIAYDSQFHDEWSRVWPGGAQMAARFAGDENRAGRETHAFRNGSLGGAYLLIAARALGLDAGPMSGFDNAKVDAEFFPDGRWKSNFLCNLGHGDPAKLHPRNLRLPFEEACRIV